MNTLGKLVSLGYQQLPCNTAQPLTVPADAQVALIRAEAQALRWRDDGTAPTATVGVPMLVADAPLEFSGNLAALQVIAQVAGGIANIAYYKIAG